MSSRETSFQWLAIKCRPCRYSGVGVGVALLLGNYYVSGMETMLGVQRQDSRHRVHCYQLRADLDEVACGGRGERGAASFILLFEVSPVPNLTLM